MKKVLTLLMSSAVLFVLPGCTNNNELAQSVIINAPLGEVWDYNSDDENAKNWSVFFAKIIPCPTQDCPQNKSLKPGDIGSTRRCFRNENEQGVFWDETTLESYKKEASAYRKIITHNINGYRSKSLKNKAEFVVEQKYKKIASNKTELTFSVKLQETNKLRVNNDSIGGNDSNFWDHLSINTNFTLGEDRTIDILNKNLQNIKLAIEMKSSYIRKFPYSKFCDVKNFWCSKEISDF